MKSAKSNKSHACSTMQATENELLPTLTTNNMIPEEVVTPPPYLWDRIEQTLNQQDTRRKYADDMISLSFRNSKLHSDI